MNIDRHLINLFFEIKQNLPYEKRTALKISSPSLITEMHDLSSSYDNPATQSLITVFIDYANKLQQGTTSTGKNTLKQEREKSKANTVGKSDRTAHPKNGKQRYYRGALIEKS